ncbi:MAG: PEP-CTERM sorting domain-containing protein [Candidatus Eisenbacteria bacterium]|nr:PEP-CTERM sorting domain-containing protein [Candidatus Eisenbacteria bacterium]
MTKLLLLAALCAVHGVASSAWGYSILWGDVIRGDLVTGASAASSESWQFSNANATTSLPERFCESRASTDDGLGWGIAQAQSSAWGADTYAEGGWNSSGYASAAFARAFRVVGGTGGVDVSIGVNVSAVGYPFGHFVETSWSAGVDGLSGISGFYGGYGFDEWVQDQWTGRLEYGETYAFRLGLSADAAECWNYSSIAIVPSSPVPEPASLLLLGLGLVPLLRKRQRSIAVSAQGRLGLCRLIRCGFPSIPIHHGSLRAELPARARRATRTSGRGRFSAKGRPGTRPSIRLLFRNRRIGTPVAYPSSSRPPATSR